MTSEHESHIYQESGSSIEEKTTMVEEAEVALSCETNKKSDSEAAATSSDDTNDSNHQEAFNVETVENHDDNNKNDVSPDSNDETTQEDNRPEPQPLFEQPIIVDGKRSRKPTLRLEVSELTPTKKELSIPQGHGKPLGEIEYINYQISHASTDALSRMRAICFGRRGNKATIRKNLREFKGFEFERNSEEYQKHFNSLIKLKKDELKSISVILGLTLNGRNTDHAERILHFLMKPVDEGKRIRTRKSGVGSAKKRNSKRPSTKSKESSDTDSEEKSNKNQDNSKEQTGSNYLYTPGKKSSNKRSSDHLNSSNAKRKKRTPATSESKENHDTNTVISDTKIYDEEAEKANDIDTVNDKLIEQIDALEEPMKNVIQEVI